MTREPLWRRYFRFFGPDPGRDLDDEMQLHYDLRLQEYQRRGLSPEEARARVQAESGDIERAKRECRAIDRRELRSATLRVALDGWRRDLIFGVRGIRRAPGFSLVAILTLAIGIGATAAIFSVVNGVLLRPLPYPAAEALVRLYEVSPAGDRQNPVSAGNVLDWQARATSFAAMGAHRFPYQVTQSGDGEPVQVTVDDITPAALRVLDPRPMVGRLFTPEDAAGRGRVVLLAHGYWRDRFGEDRDVLGRMVVLDDVPHEIVGVMGPEFAFPLRSVNLWRPVPDAALDPTSRISHNWAVIARLNAGVDRPITQAELSGIAASLGRDYPEFMQGWDVNVTSLHGDLVAPVRPLLLVLLGGVGLVLLIACTNVANLLLARAITRDREMAVRGALGAGRGRLVRQLVVEGSVLAAAAGIAGVLLGAWMLEALLWLAPSDIPLLDEVRLDRTVLAFAALVTAGSTVAFALVPALRLARTDLQVALRADRSGTGGHARLRAALLVFEVAVSLVLLVGAGLLVRSFDRLQSVDLGFDPAGVLAVTVTPPAARYADITAQREFHQRLRERVATLPGLAGVTSTSATPSDPNAVTFSFAIQGRVSPNPSGRFDPVPLELVTHDYFRVLGIPVRRGRAFDRPDRTDAPPVAIINQALARRLWPGEDPVGQRIAFRPPQSPWIEIIGVAGDTRMLGADLDPVPMLYLPYDQHTWAWFRWQTLLLRVAADVDPSALVPAVRSALREVDPQIAPSLIATVDRLYAEGARQRRFATVLLGAFALAALGLGLIGLYGVLSTAVGQRRQELAIRIALGADRRRVVGLILKQALELAAAGLGVGLAAAVGLTRLLRALLFGVSPLDPVTFGAVTVLLLSVSACAALVPARRAARIDPVVTMRGE